jgi:hypothetical protein
MSTEEWQRISADGAPPGVYTPNMSAADQQLWKAKYTGGQNPRVEIRKTVTGPRHPAPGWAGFKQNYAQLLVIVDAASVRLSSNGTADFTGGEFEQLAQAVAEARAVLAQRLSATVAPDKEEAE